MSAPIKTILVGCGSMSNQWLECAKKSERIEICGLVDLNLEAAQRQKDKFGLENAQIGQDLAAMIQTTGAEAVFDVTIPDVHHSVAMTAFEHGCHLLSEKPMTSSMDQARETLAASQKAKRLYMVMQNRRYDQNIHRFKQGLVSTKALGDITTVNADFYIGAHFSNADKIDFRDNTKHVLLLDMAIHSFDQARYLSDASPMKVYAHEFNPAGSWYQYGASAHVIFQMSDGIVFNYRGSWCSEGLNTNWECDWKIVTSKGAASWDGAQNMKMEVAKGNEGFTRPKEILEWPTCKELEYTGHNAVIQEFIKAHDSDYKPMTLAEDNIKSLAMVHAAIESAECGQAVNIKL